MCQQHVRAVQCLIELILIEWNTRLTSYLLLWYRSSMWAHVELNFPKHCTNSKQQQWKKCFYKTVSSWSLFYCLGCRLLTFFTFYFFVLVLSIIKTNQSGWAHHFLASFCCGAFHLLKFNSYDIANWTSLHFLITICFLKICKILIDLHSCVNKRLKLTD